MRSKEEAQDYRYFPEPDLVPVHPPAELVEELEARVRELPSERIASVGHEATQRLHCRQGFHSIGRSYAGHSRLVTTVSIRQ